MYERKTPGNKKPAGDILQTGMRREQAELTIFPTYEFPFTSYDSVHPAAEHFLLNLRQSFFGFRQQSLKLHWELPSACTGPDVHQQQQISQSERLFTGTSPTQGQPTPHEQTIPPGPGWQPQRASMG
jgi:hypothetical protein